VPAQEKTVVLADRTWHCKHPVNLDLVRVTMHDGRSDAVHLDGGCTGTIRRLVVPGNGDDLGPGGDGVKVHAGVHDLKILSGVIQCGKKFHRKHQDAIQAMGGRRVTFFHIVSSGCSNSFMFLSSGLHKHELPTEVVCRDCAASTRNYSVRVNAAVRSGAIGGTFTSRLKPNSGPEAVDPVLVGNTWTPRPGAER